MKELIQYRPRKNNQIKASQVRLINSDGTNLGIMSLWDAIQKGKEQGLDVIELNSKVKPIVCRLGDFGKFLYEAKKEQSELKKKQFVQLTKQLFCHITTEQNDLSRQVEQARQFLLEGHKVLFFIKLRGREMGKPELAREKLLAVLEALKTDASEYTQPLLEGRNMVISLSPPRKKQ